MRNVNLWPFDIKTGPQVARDMAKLQFNFGLSRHFQS